MLNRTEHKTKYFSTKSELKINGVVYRPSICYKAPALAMKSLEKFVEKGTVTLYDSPVRFVNGGVAKAPEQQITTGVPSVVRETVEKPSKKKGK
jgi:hypothetical protein